MSAYNDMTLLDAVLQPPDQVAGSVVLRERQRDDGFMTQISENFSRNLGPVPVVRKGAPIRPIWES
ncbi:hypothetical protein GCM10028799_00680 [Kribbella italica]